ncbi:MAG TPA: peptidoglycan-binding domain-containing protein [Burkholderiales bacterium]|nr:peptidoglycan-binding domain-containing protein [Burkholderiales bacterium]
MEKLISFLKGVSVKTWIIIAIILVFIIFLIMYIKNNNKKTGDDVKSNLSDSKPRSVFPLVYGSKGEEVKVLQRYLKSKGQNIGNTGLSLDGVDGIWGPKTDAAVMAVLNKTSISESDFKSLV